MNPEITPLLFEDHLVRIVTKDGEPWFVAQDICDTLGILNARDAIAKALDPDEAGVDTIYTSSDNGTEQRREVRVINESGVYALIFKSRKPEARRFRKWVTSEVLPAIRRSGSYGTAHQTFLSLLRDQIALGVSPDIAAKCALRLSPDQNVIQQINTPQHPQMSEMDDVLSRMEIGREYTLSDIIALLPPKHSLVYKKTLPSIGSSIGKLMDRARKFEKVEKVHGNRAIYRLLADIIPIAEGR